MVAGYLGSLGVMKIEHSIASLLAVLFFVLAGLGVLLVCVNTESRRKKVHAGPLFALYRFRTFRYGVAVAFFILAAVAFVESLR